MHQIPTLERISNCLAVVFAESLEARGQAENEYAVVEAPTGDAPTTSEWSTIQLPTKVWLILDMWRYIYIQTHIYIYIYIYICMYSIHTCVSVYIHTASQSCIHPSITPHTPPSLSPVNQSIHPSLLPSYHCRFSFLFYQSNPPSGLWLLGHGWLITSTFNTGMWVSIHALTSQVV